jgi:uncharacterized protein YxjI
MNYPITLSFKLLAIASQIYVTDGGGHLIGYVKQKLFKLKEAITMFADESQTQPLYEIKADRMLDFSANYHFSDMRGNQFGSVKRQGMRSLWSAHYDIFVGNSPTFIVQEANPWIKVVDSLVGELPIIGMFTGYFLQPAYNLTRSNGQVVMRLAKQPAFFEGRFVIEKHANLSEHEEVCALLGLMMVVVLERARG